MVSMQQEKSSRARSSASVGSLGGRHGAAFWSEERASGSVGVALLERMGWQEGRGLGKQEAGTQSFIRAKLKNDTVGIGAKKGAPGDDRQHTFAQATTDIFNALLTKLNAAHSSIDERGEGQGKARSEEKKELEKDEEEDTSTVGDAAASIDRYVRKRHLYGRFSRAKDTSLYSQKSKLEIFGRKQPTNQAADTADNNSTGQDNSASPPPPSVSLTTSSVSIQSYFASKMAAARQRQQQQAGVEGAEWAARVERTEADGSAAWQTAVFDDISQRSQTGRAGLGARHSHSNTRTTTTTATTTTATTSTTTHSSQHSQQRHHSHTAEPAVTAATSTHTAAAEGVSPDMGAMSGSEVEKAERKKKRRERKEAASLEKEQRQQEEQQNTIQPSTAQESADGKKRRKKQKRERDTASLS